MTSLTSSFPPPALHHSQDQQASRPCRRFKCTTEGAGQLVGSSREQLRPWHLLVQGSWVLQSFNNTCASWYSMFPLSLHALLQLCITLWFTQEEGRRRRWRHVMLFIKFSDRIRELKDLPFVILVRLACAVKLYRQVFWLYIRWGDYEIKHSRGE